MQKSPIIFSMMALAGCSSPGAGNFMDHGVVQIDSCLYEVAATRSKDASTDLEHAKQPAMMTGNSRGWLPGFAECSEFFQGVQLADY